MKAEGLLFTPYSKIASYMSLLSSIIRLVITANIQIAVICNTLTAGLLKLQVHIDDQSYSELFNSRSWRRRKHAEPDQMQLRTLHLPVVVSSFIAHNFVPPCSDSEIYILATWSPSLWITPGNYSGANMMPMRISWQCHRCINARLHLVLSRFPRAAG
jgi:hypothetical protein